MADTTVLEAVAVRRAGSSPVLGTINGLCNFEWFDLTYSYTALLYREFIMRVKCTTVTNLVSAEESGV